MYEDNQNGDVALGSLAKGVLAGLASQGGQLTIFLSSLPKIGPGKLKPREDPLVYGTDKEKTLYGPGDPFWRNTAEELAEAGVGVNVFFFPERYIDVASVGEHTAKAASLLLEQGSTPMLIGHTFQAYLQASLVVNCSSIRDSILFGIVGGCMRRSEGSWHRIWRIM